MSLYGNENNDAADIANDEKYFTAALMLRINMN